MTTSPVTTLTDELVSEIEATAYDSEFGVVIEAQLLRALLAERAELKRDAERLQTIKANIVIDAERYRWLRVASAGDDSATPHGLCVELWDTGSGHEITGDDLDTAIDTAINQQKEPTQ